MRLPRLSRVASQLHRKVGIVPQTRRSDRSGNNPYKKAAKKEYWGNTPQKTQPDRLGKRLLTPQASKALRLLLQCASIYRIEAANAFL